MSEKWVFPVCDNSVGKEQKYCNICGCSSDVNGDEYSSRKRHWEKHVNGNDVLKSSGVDKAYNFIPESDKEKRERKVWGRNKFGACWAIVLMYTPIMLVHFLFVNVEKVLVGLPILIYVLFMMRPYYIELLKYRQFLLVSLAIFIINTVLVYVFQVAPEAKNIAGGLMLFVIMPAMAFTGIYSIKSKHSKSINAAYNNSSHSAN